MERRFVIYLPPSFYNVISLNKAPLKWFLKVVFNATVI